jgi:UDP:flavonoid glycosyltransferase YjiC (YdhE family)
MLFLPKIANQPQVAAAVTAFGAGITPDSLAGSVPALLDDLELRRHAVEARDRLADRPSPDAVWSALRARNH